MNLPITPVVFGLVGFGLATLAIWAGLAAWGQSNEARDRQNQIDAAKAALNSQFGPVPVPVRVVPQWFR